MTLSEGGLIMRGTDGRNDQKVLQNIGRMTDIFPSLRINAIIRLNGGATREFKEEIAGNSSDPHPEVRVAVIGKLPLESAALLDSLRRDTSEPLAVRDAADRRYNGLHMLRRGKGGPRARPSSGVANA